jgi:hypothetical protein
VRKGSGVRKGRLGKNVRREVGLDWERSAGEEKENREVLRITGVAGEGGAKGEGRTEV